MVGMPATEVIMGCWLNLVNNPVHNTHVGPGWSEVHRKTPWSWGKWKYNYSQFVIYINLAGGTEWAEEKDIILDHYGQVFCLQELRLMTVWYLMDQSSGNSIYKRLRRSVEISKMVCIGQPKFVFDLLITDDKIPHFPYVPPTGFVPDVKVGMINSNKGDWIKWFYCFIIFHISHHFHNSIGRPTLRTKDKQHLYS